jgi:hypothetical protein
MVRMSMWCPCDSGVLVNPAKHALVLLLYVSCNHRLHFQFCLMWESQMTSCMNSIIGGPEGHVRSPCKQLGRVTKVIHLPWWYPSRNLTTMPSRHEAANSNMCWVSRWALEATQLSSINTLRTGLLNCLNARSRGLTVRHCASCI